MLLLYIKLKISNYLLLYSQWVLTIIIYYTIPYYENPTFILFLFSILRFLKKKNKKLEYGRLKIIFEVYEYLGVIILKLLFNQIVVLLL